MTDHVFHDLQHYMTVTVVIMALSLLVWVPMYLRISRNATFEDNVQDAIVLDPAHERVGTSAPGRQDISAQDTVFIMPDISHYTRFIAGGHFTDSCAQEIIFSLINAMISAGTKTVELSKLEGDAVLFYTDARKNTDVEIGQTVMAIFDAFFEERRRLIDSGICSCRSCEHIKDLDLKIFIHRGQAKRFSFRGSIDHFGADVTILHKLMKNSVAADRYVMVTQAATDDVRLSGNLGQHQVEEDLEHVGKIQATVYTFRDQVTRPVVTRAPEPCCSPAYG